MLRLLSAQALGKSQHSKGISLPQSDQLGVEGTRRAQTTFLQKYFRWRGGDPKNTFFFRLPLHPLEPLTQNVCYIIIIFVCWCLCLGREGWWPIYQQSVLLMDPFFAPQSPQGIPQKKMLLRTCPLMGWVGWGSCMNSLYHKLHKGTKKKNTIRWHVHRGTH